MQKLHQSILIKANKETVWSIIVDLEKYKKWAEVFTSGSYFEGGWNEGDEIYFLMTDEEGNKAGMFSQIDKSDLYKFISIKHLGMIKNGIKDFTSELAKKWSPAFENYTLVEKESDLIEFVVDMDVEDEYKTEFEDLWSKALVRIKEISEKE